MAIITTEVTPINLEQTQQLIGTFMAEYCDIERTKALQLHPSYARLWQAIHHQVSSGGKRLRPYLLLLAYEAFGGTDQAVILPIAAAWEFLHTSMLMHDDVIDRDYTRHGQLNVSGRYLEHYKAIDSQSDRVHYADAAAILAGDLVVTSAQRIISDSQLTSDQKRAASSLFYDTTFTVIGGELLDYEVATVDESIDPLLIAEAKTASYSLVGPLMTGAMLAGATEASQQSLQELGRVLGIGFQLVDDILGIFGDPAVMGKSVDTDLAEGKRTMVVIESLRLMDDASRARAESLLRNPSQSNVAELRSLISATPVEQKIRTQLSDYKQQALQLIEQLSMIDSAHMQAFRAVVGSLLERNA